MKQIRILLADDHNVMRRGLRLLLESQPDFCVVGEAADGRQAVAQAELTKPDVAVLDIAMPFLSGTEAAQRIGELLPSTAIVILSMHSDEAYVLRALKAGARGYLLKASPEADVLAAVRAVAAGNAYFSPSITKLLVEEYVLEARRRGVDDSYDLLSVREKEILLLLASGKSNRDIADQLHISVATVETHRNNVFQKLHLHNLAELILYAVRKGLIS